MMTPFAKSGQYEKAPARAGAFRIHLKKLFLHLTTLARAAILASAEQFVQTDRDDNQRPVLHQSKFRPNVKSTEEKKHTENKHKGALTHAVATTVTHHHSEKVKKLEMKCLPDHIIIWTESKESRRFKSFAFSKPKSYHSNLIIPTTVPITPEQYEEFHSPEFSQITDVIWDGDNTIWDWVTYAVHAYEAMSQAIADETGIPESKVAAAMKRFYTSIGTMEDERLIQGLTAEGFFKDVPNFNCDKLIMKAQKAFTTERKKYLRTYPGIYKVIKTLHEHGIKNHILTDAPRRQASQRIKRSRINVLIDQVNAMPSRDPDNLPEKFRQKERDGVYDVDFEVTEIPWEKPFTNLEEVLSMTREQIQRNVVLAGDNNNKEMELVRIYGCRGIHAVYGEVDKNFLKRILRFAGEKVVRKNFALDKEQRANDQIPTGPKGVIVEVDKPRQIFDVFNIHPKRKW